MAGLDDILAMSVVGPLLDGAYLVFGPGNRRRVKDPEKALTEFAGIERGEDVVKFASKFGVLELDESGAHSTDIWRRAALLGNTRFPTSGREPIGHWLTLSLLFRSLLGLSRAVHYKRDPDLSDWDGLQAGIYLLEGRQRRTTAAPETKQLPFWIECVVGDLVISSNLRPALRWKWPRNPSIEFGVGSMSGLFDLLLFRLMLQLARAEGLDVCAACGCAFVPKVRARRGKLRFCDVCRENGSANRISAKEYRRTKTRSV